MRFQIRKPRYLIKPDSKMDKWLSKQFGSTLFSYGEIISMFIPIMLDQFFINFISVLTTSMISASSQESVSAVNLVSPVYMMIFAIFNAVSAGGTVIVAQYKGKGDNEKNAHRCRSGRSGYDKCCYCVLRNFSYLCWTACQHHVRFCRSRCH